MKYETAIRDAFKTLSEEQKAEVIDFILFLRSKSETEKEEKGFPFDIFAGDMTYISDDFNETPECFGEYL